MRAVSLLSLVLLVAAPTLAAPHDDLDEKIQELSHKINTSPKAMHLYLERGELYRMDRQWRKALADYELVEKLDPSWSGLDYYRGRLYFDARRVPEAERALAKFLKQVPAHGEARLFLARTLTRAGRHAEAAQQMALAMEHLSPLEPTHFLEYARMLEASGEDGLAPAIDALDRGLRTLGSPVTLDLCAIDIELKLGRTDDALARLDRITEMSPRKETWLLRRGEIELAAGREDAARRTLRRAWDAFAALPERIRRREAAATLSRRILAKLGELGESVPMSAAAPVAQPTPQRFSPRVPQPWAAAPLARRRAPASPGSTVPRITRGPYLQMGTPDGIVVRWRTDLPATSRVQYGPAPLSSGGPAPVAVDDLTPKTEHEITLSGLTPQTQYFYTVGTQADVLAGGDDRHYFVTSPTPGSRRPMRIWVLGDSGTKLDPARDVRDAYYDFTGPRHTDLWLMLGDNAYVYGTDQDHQDAIFEDMYEDMLVKSALWPTEGNHDALSADATTETGPFFDIFTLPRNGEAGGMPSGTEGYYSFDFGNIHFVCLNSTTPGNAFNNGQLTWLAADLASTLQDWTIAFWHHPPYSKGTHDSDTDTVLTTVRQMILPIIEAHGVDLVLTGHSHVYERSMLIDGHYGDSMSFDPTTMAKDTGDGGLILGTGAYRIPTIGPAPHQGTVYTVCGCSGEVYGGALDHPVMVSALNVRGSVVLDVNGTQLDALFIDDQGYARDQYTIVKGGTTPVNRHHAPLFTLGQWKFEDTGSNLGTDWHDPDFDISEWSSGTAPLGYGNPLVATPLSGGTDANTRPTTTYFRTTFDIDCPLDTIEAIHGYVVYDDGFVAYVNGFEVARASMPPGPVTSSTFALQHDGTRLELIDLSAAIPHLLPGRNSIAIEVHQANDGGEDMVFDMAIAYEAFVPLLGEAAAGALVDQQGEPVEVFAINGTTGGMARSVDIRLNDPITFSVAQPPMNPLPAHYVIFGTIGTPTDADAYPLPDPTGVLCFPPAPRRFNDNTLFVMTSSYGPFPGELVASAPTPWVYQMNPGFPFPVTLTLQPVVEQAPGVVRVTNAIRMEVLP